jgi:hypothetical protein
MQSLFYLGAVHASNTVANQQHCGRNTCTVEQSKVLLTVSTLSPKRIAPLTHTHTLQCPWDKRTNPANNKGRWNTEYAHKQLMLQLHAHAADCIRKRHTTVPTGLAGRRRSWWPVYAAPSSTKPGAFRDFSGARSSRIIFGGCSSRIIE